VPFKVVTVTDRYTRQLNKRRKANCACETQRKASVALSVVKVGRHGVPADRVSDPAGRLSVPATMIRRNVCKAQIHHEKVKVLAKYDILPETIGL